MKKKRYYPPQPQRVATNCFICNKLLTKQDKTLRRDGYCKHCRSEQAFIYRLRQQTDEQLRESRAKYKRYVKIYTEVIEDRLRQERKERQKNEMQEEQL